MLHRVEKEVIKVIKDGKLSGKLKGTIRDDIAKIIKRYAENLGGE